EITAIPKLLEVLDLRGAIVTLDAMGCQKDIAAKIVTREADYVLGLKGNHQNLHAAVEAYFEQAITDDFANTPHAIFEEETKKQAHGRIEHRKLICTNDLAWFDNRGDWAGLKSISMVEATRTLNGKTSTERR